MEATDKSRDAMEEAVSELRLNATIDFIEKRIDSRTRALEIGSSDATFQELLTTASWTTVDKYGTPSARVDLDGVNCVLPFEDESFDLIVCTEVLAHLRIGSPLVREMARVLSSSGIAVVSVPNICSLSSRIRILTGRVPTMAASGDCGPPLGGTGMMLDGNWVAGHVADFNHKRLTAFLERGGFRVTEVGKIPIEMPPYLSFKRAKFALPRWLLPATFSDFVLVAARPDRVLGRQSR